MSVRVCIISVSHSPVTSVGFVYRTQPLFVWKVHFYLSSTLPVTRTLDACPGSNRVGSQTKGQVVAELRAVVDRRIVRVTSKYFEEIDIETNFWIKVSVLVSSFIKSLILLSFLQLTLKQINSLEPPRILYLQLRNNFQVCLDFEWPDQPVGTKQYLSLGDSKKKKNESTFQVFPKTINTTP